MLRKARKLATRLGTQVIEEKAAALEGGMDPGDDLYAYLRKFLVWSISACELTPRFTVRQNTTLTKEDIATQTCVLLVAGQDTTVSLCLYTMRAFQGYC
jgi:hypothetical protein